VKPVAHVIDTYLWGFSTPHTIVIPEGDTTCLGFRDNHKILLQDVREDPRTRLREVIFGFHTFVRDVVLQLMVGDEERYNSVTFMSGAVHKSYPEPQTPWEIWQDLAQEWKEGALLGPPKLLLSDGSVFSPLEGYLAFQGA
jgi:hypothetical protein